MSKPFIRVATGLILDSRGRLLLGQRPDGRAWPGWWEFPGGKIESGETAIQALARELEEELGIHVTKVYPWLVYTYEYPRTIVELSICQVTDWQGEPYGKEGQALDWVDPLAIHLDENEHPVAPGGGSLLPAAAAPLRWLRLPILYRCSNIHQASGLEAWLSQLRHELLQGLRLVQFREPGWQGSQEALHNAFVQTLDLCRQHNARCMINSCHPQGWWSQADGVQLRAADAARILDDDTRPPGWLGVSAHNEADIDCAQQLHADFVVLGHVLPTPSHHGSPALGWERFQTLAALAQRPVFAIGGQSMSTLEQARLHGAHGIAAIRGQLISHSGNDDAR